MEKGNIIFLNGVSSAGKSTLTKAIQNKLDIPYYHICCDDFMNMTPKHILDKDFTNQLNITQVMMHDVIKMYSNRGHNVIVDDVVLDLPEYNDWMYDYVKMFEGYPVLSVNVKCQLEELERREKARGDRAIGQAKWQLTKMPQKWIYDMAVNTSLCTTEECAYMIIHRLNDKNSWSAFYRLKAQFENERANN